MKSIDKILIRDFLTIRYTPKNPPTLPALWSDFFTKNSDLTGKKTEKLLTESISKSIPEDDEKIVVSLSSGIDSTLCLALLRKIYPKRKIVAICAVFSNSFDESERAKIIAEKFNADFKVFHVDSIFTRMPELVSITRKPRWNSYQHLVAKEAKKFGKILVTGDGADEIFGGYVFRYKKFLRLHRPHQNWKIKIINYLECHNRDWVHDQKEMFGSAIKFDWEKIYSYFKPYFVNKLKPIEQVMLADFNGKLLYDFIPTGQDISKHYKIRITPIFLNEQVIKFGLGLPQEQKYDLKNDKGKLILRKITKQLDVPHIDSKKGFSPDLLIDWDKKGRKICELYLLEKNNYIFENKLIDFNWVVRSFEKVDQDGDIRYLNRLISLLALEIWYRIFVEKNMSPQKMLN